MKSRCPVEPKSTAPESASATKTPVAPHALLQQQAAIGNQAMNQWLNQQYTSEEALVHSRDRTLAPPRLARSATPKEPHPTFRGLSHELGQTLQPSVPIQAKLAIGQSGDKYEQEADQIAADVVDRLNGSASRQMHQSQIHQGQTLQHQESVAGTLLRMQPLVQNQLVAEEDPTSSLEASINQARSSGQALPNQIRVPMEQAFGTDFRDVKIHTDDTADSLNRSLQSYAFTSHQNIFLRRGAYNPSSQQGKALLAHELTHVIQQNSKAAQLPRRIATDIHPLSNSTKQPENLGTWLTAADATFR